MPDDVAFANSRIQLRSCMASDIPSLMEGLNDWRIAQWMPSAPFPYTEADARLFIAEVTDSPPSAYAIVDLATSEFLGIISLTAKGNAGELGYWLLPRHQGTGIMRAAVACLIEQRGGSLASIFATVDPGNASSIGLLERSGFHRTGEHIRDTPNRQGNTVVLRYQRDIR